MKFDELYDSLIKETEIPKGTQIFPKKLGKRLNRAHAMRKARKQPIGKLVQMPDRDDPKRFYSKDVAKYVKKGGTYYDEK